MIKKTYDWLSTKVHTPQAPLFLALFSLLESLIFPPVAPLLILFCIENRKRSFFYAGIVTLFSVLGGIIAYYCGYALWETVGQRLVLFFTSQDTFDRLVEQYQHYEFLAVAAGSFLPVPYRLVGLSAGFCQLPLATFIASSFVGRGLRYFLVGAAMYVWGDRIKMMIDRWFNQLVLLFVVMVIVGFSVLLKN